MIYFQTMFWYIVKLAICMLYRTFRRKIEKKMNDVFAFMQSFIPESSRLYCANTAAFLDHRIAILS